MHACDDAPPVVDFKVVVDGWPIIAVLPNHLHQRMGRRLQADQPRAMGTRTRSRYLTRG